MYCEIIIKYLEYLFNCVNLKDEILIEFKKEKELINFSLKDGFYIVLFMIFYVLLIFYN